MQKKYILVLLSIFQSNLFASGLDGEAIADLTANFIGIPLSFVSVILSVGFGMADKKALNIGKIVGMTIVWLPLFLVNLFYFLCNAGKEDSLLNSQKIFSFIGLFSITIGYSRLMYLFIKKTDD